MFQDSHYLPAQEVVMNTGLPRPTQTCTRGVLYNIDLIPGGAQGIYGYSKH